MVGTEGHDVIAGLVGDDKIEGLVETTVCVMMLVMTP
ncbi:MAG: hypothetical protein ACJ70U_04220 [Nitrososphaera sp.]